MQPQERADRLRVFHEELEHLGRENILELTPEQRASVDAYISQTLGELARSHDVDTSEPQRQISLGMRIASALGGLALCAAIVLFFRAYVGFWTAWIQVTAISLAPILLTLLTAWVARREETRYYTTLLSLLAFAAFVANLSLLGSIFNLAPTPNAFAVWGAFGLVLAYHFGVRLVLAAGLTSLLGWVSSSTDYWRGWWWLDFNRQSEQVMLAGLVVAAVPLVAGHAKRDQFPAVYRLVGSLAFFTAMLWLSFSGHDSHFGWEAKAVEHFYQFAGVAASALAIWTGIRWHWTGVVNTGTAFFTIFLFFRLVDWWWNVLPTYLFFLAIGLIAIGLLAAFKRLRARMKVAA